MRLIFKKDRKKLMFQDMSIGQPFTRMAIYNGNTSPFLCIKISSEKAFSLTNFAIFSPTPGGWWELVDGTFIENE